MEKLKGGKEQLVITEIPYTMKNRSDRPIDNRPGADPRSTLDTPKFIQFGW